MEYPPFHLGKHDDMVHVFLRHEMILVSKELLGMGPSSCQLPVHSQELPGGMQVSITQKQAKAHEYFKSKETQV